MDCGSTATAVTALWRQSSKGDASLPNQYPAPEMTAFRRGSVRGIVMILIAATWQSSEPIFAQAAARRPYRIEELLDSSGSHPEAWTEEATASISYRDPRAIAQSTGYWRSIAEGKKKKLDGSDYTRLDREYARSLANNLNLRAGLEESKGGTARRALDYAASGLVNEGAYSKIRSVRETGDLVTERDLEYFPAAPARAKALRTESTLLETLHVDASPVIVLAGLCFVGLLVFAYSARKSREQSAKERSLRYWKEGLKLGVGFAAWIAVANRLSPAPFSDRLGDSAGAFLIALTAGILVGIVSGAGATLISEQRLSGNRIARAALTITLTFAQLGLFATILG